MNSYTVGELTVEIDGDTVYFHVTKDKRQPVMAPVLLKNILRELGDMKIRLSCVEVKRRGKNVV